MKSCKRSALNVAVNNSFIMEKIVKGVALKNEGLLVINKALIRLRNEYQGFIHGGDSRITSLTVGSALADYLGYSYVVENTGEIK